MIRFLADADLRHRIVYGCRRREPSIDFLLAIEAALQRAPDPELLAFAAEQGRVLVSSDSSTMTAHFRDFLKIHASSPGLIIVPQRVLIGRAIEDLLTIWGASNAEEWVNRIAWLPL